MFEFMKRIAKLEKQQEQIMLGIEGNRIALNDNREKMHQHFEDRISYLQTQIDELKQPKKKAK